jgi:hypothetical protein
MFARGAVLCFKGVSEILGVLMAGALQKAGRGLYFAFFS